MAHSRRANHNSSNPHHVAHADSRSISPLVLLTLILISGHLAPTRPKVRYRIPRILLREITIPSMPLVPCLLHLSCNRGWVLWKLLVDCAVEVLVFVPLELVFWFNLMAYTCAAVGVVLEIAVTTMQSFLQVWNGRWRNS